ncbi:hypothetical protein YPPY54_1928, partial [Yersinia pestis PY-54]
MHPSALSTTMVKYPNAPIYNVDFPLDILTRCAFQKTH